MSDDEDYNSEEDLDYVPSDGEQVSEEENSGEEEDLSVLQDGETDSNIGSKRQRQGGKKKKIELSVRKRKGGIKLDDHDDGEKNNQLEIESEEKHRKQELAEQISKDSEERKEEKEKKRADDLWASFMTDVGKPPAKSTNHSSTGNGLGNLMHSQENSSSSSNQTKKVTITKVFDFAGEEVKVTKEVDANSAEAQKEKKKQEEQVEEETVKVQTKPLAIPEPSQQLSSLKRPGSGGLGSVLSKIGKKSKMGTLEKSKLDWESFKTKEGIQDDLKIHNKGKQGYTERMAFLNRTDQRQYLLERDLRLGSSSKR